MFHVYTCVSQQGFESILELDRWTVAAMFFFNSLSMWHVTQMTDWLGVSNLKKHVLTNYCNRLQCQWLKLLCRYSVWWSAKVALRHLNVNGTIMALKITVWFNAWGANTFSVSFLQCYTCNKREEVRSVSFCPLTSNAVNQPTYIWNPTFTSSVSE